MWFGYTLGAYVAKSQKRHIGMMWKAVTSVTALVLCVVSAAPLQVSQTDNAAAVIEAPATELAAQNTALKFCYTESDSSNELDWNGSAPHVALLCHHLPAQCSSGESIDRAFVDGYPATGPKASLPARAPPVV